ncbi:hypothetical protein, partial [Mycoplasma sp. HS2188]|uniref:hypothetical protein n=1 Tax=Mycoplasma sp. HS2188 TaxID=2976765 RepID=UPI0037CB4721|nr:hypothetical protein [Mycoplasma sp. HS2188]
LKKVSNTQAYNDALISVLSKKDILAECKELQQHFNEYGYLAPKAELLKNDKNEDFRKINDQDKITNSIELELYIENFLYTNKTYFIDTTKYNINKWIKSTFIDDPNKPEYISANLIWFVISYLYISQIKQIHKEQINKHKRSQHEKEFILSKQNSLPSNEYQWINNDLHFAFDNEFDEAKLNYAYQNTFFIDEKEKYKHYLDSHNEEIILSALKNVFKEKYKNNVQAFYDKVKIWSKNPALNGVNYEYYSKDYDIKNSFPDIVIKYGNHQLIIEVKDATNDYDKDKTKKIVEAYRAYINDHSDNSFDLVPLTLLVCKVKKEDSQNNKNGQLTITFEGASTNELFNKKINDGEFDKKGFAIDNIFKDMFDLIDELDNNLHNQ